jgi:hypothetical protein
MKQKELGMVKGQSRDMHCSQTHNGPLIWATMSSVKAQSDNVGSEVVA